MQLVYELHLTISREKPKKINQNMFHFASVFLESGRMQSKLWNDYGISIGIILVETSFPQSLSE